MADKTGIEWTDATWVVDRGGHCVRSYVRQDPRRPGQQERRSMAAMGLRWCRECCWWLKAGDVTKNGLCRAHEREDYRRRYAADPVPIRARVHARKRGVAPVPPDADLVLELLVGRCAYCPEPATSWDHVVPVAAGGETEPGNVLPACVSCNSSKNARDLMAWLVDTGRTPSTYAMEYLATLGVAA